MSEFSYSLLTKTGLNFSQIKDIFDKIGLQKAASCRLNIINFHKSDFKLNSGGK